LCSDFPIFAEIARVPSTSSQGGYIEKVKVPCYDLASVGAQQYDFFLDVHRIGSNDLLQGFHIPNPTVQGAVSG